MTTPISREAPKRGENCPHPPESLHLVHALSQGAKLLERWEIGFVAWEREILP